MWPVKDVGCENFSFSPHSARQQTVVVNYRDPLRPENGDIVERVWWWWGGITTRALVIGDTTDASHHCSATNKRGDHPRLTLLSW